MRRRSLLGATVASNMWPSLVGAQQKAMPVIGNLSSTSPVAAEAKYVAAFIQGLGETGHVVGQNVTIEYRYAEGSFDRLPALAAGLVERKVAVITTGSLPGAIAAKNATSTIPIVFSFGADPVAAGLVSNLARPGGNITGVSVLNVELVPKRMDLLCELVPDARVVALLVNPNNPASERQIRDAQAAAQARGVEIAVVRAGSEREIGDAFILLAERKVAALLVGTDPVFATQRDQLVALASRHAVATIFGFATTGALISYGPNLLATNRQVGVYAGRILKGEKPGDLPVVQPATFELVVNTTTARALGLTIPRSILARADEVIE